MNETLFEHTDGVYCAVAVVLGNLAHHLAHPLLDLLRRDYDLAIVCLRPFDSPVFPCASTRRPYSIGVSSITSVSPTLPGGEKFTEGANPRTQTS